jgi:uncharacterized protein YggL (DUF469 family)
MNELFLFIYNQIKTGKFQSVEVCREYGYKLERLKKSFDLEEFQRLLFLNIEWLINGGVITPDQLREFYKGREFTFQKSGFIFEGSVEGKDAKLVLFGNASAEVSGHSRVIAFEDSSVEAYDSSFITAYNRAKVKARDSKIIAFHTSEVESLGLCLIERYDNGVKVIADPVKNFVY